jgi:hypothetical protein
MGMCLAWRSFQAAMRRSAILKDLSISRAARSGFLLGDLPALILHFATVEAHCRMIDCRHTNSTLCATSQLGAFWYRRCYFITIGFL